MLTPEYFRQRVDVLKQGFDEQNKAIQAAQERIAKEQADIAGHKVARHTLHGALQEAQRNLDIIEGRLQPETAGPQPVAKAQAEVKIEAEVESGAARRARLGTEGNRNESEDRP